MPAMGRGTSGLRKLAGRTIAAYVRMAATVVIAVVVRICLDCIGIILTGQEAEEAGFWFAHCRRDGRCVLAGIVLFFVSLTGCSVFAWSCQEWITDPTRNPYARRFSFEVVVDAATWIPISVVVGKTNAMVEWFMDIAKDRHQAAPVLASSVALLLTLSCALLTHLIMKHCSDVQQSAQEKEGGWRGFGKFFLLTTLYCLGWAVGWSNWELVISLVDAFDMRGMAAMVIVPLLLLSTCFYLRYGPEPIIPDPRLQQLCYNHGYSSSLRRALVSYVVYSCVVFIVMCCCDPTYGILIILAQKAYHSVSEVSDARALVVLCALASTVTLLAALGSAAITWAMDVDEFSSMKLSRSVHKACQRMVTDRRSHFGMRLAQVLEDGSDARFVQEREMHAFREPSDASIGSPPDSDDGAEEPGPDGSAGDSLTLAPVAVRMPYVELPDPDEENTGSPSSPSGHVRMELASERQLRLNPRAISRGLCASVLAYDVLGLVVCFQWGMIVVRMYSVVFGHLAGIHDALYMVSCVVYAVTVVVGVSRFVFAFFPSATEESKCRDFAVCPGDDVQSGLPGLDIGSVFQRLGAGLLRA